MAFLTKDQIKAAGKPKLHVLHVPEWEGDVHIAELSGAEYDRYQAACIKASDKKDYSGVRPLLCAMLLRHEDGSRIYGDKDIAELAALRTGGLERVAKFGLSLNKIDAEAVEAEVKNSEGEASADSPGD